MRPAKAYRDAPQLAIGYRHFDRHGKLRLTDVRCLALCDQQGDTPSMTGAFDEVVPHDGLHAVALEGDMPEAS